MSKQTKERMKTEYQIDIADHPNVILWMKDVAKKDPEGFICLVRNNTTQFRHMWGKETWTNDGSKGWTSGWALYENSLHWSILTGNEGTIFRLRASIPGEEYLKDPKVGVGIVQYLNHLLKTLANA